MNHDDIMTTIMRLEREIVALKAGLTLKPKQTLWDKRDESQSILMSPCVSTRDVEEHFENVLVRLQEELNWDFDDWVKAKEIFKAEFGEELIK